MKGAAVLEIGTARAKLAVAQRTADGIETRVKKWELGLGKQDSKTGDIARLRLVANEVRETVDGAELDLVKVVATEVFRTNENLASALAMVGEILGSAVEILTPAVEAKLFWEGVSLLISGDADCAAVDIGGGSVQAVWGNGTKDFFSAPLGTYSIEKRFQKQSELLAPEEAENMRSAIHREIEPLRSSGIRRSTVIVGSTVMLDFFVSACEHFGIAQSRTQENKFPADAIDALERKLTGLRYSDAAVVFPANPGFMHGADKACIVLNEIVRALGARYVIPTNENLSSALARRAVR